MVPKRVSTLSLFILLTGALLAAATSVSFSQANGPDRPADSTDVFLPLVIHNWPSVYALSNHSELVSSIGTLWIFGEVQNDLGGPVRFVRVPITLLDSLGQVLATDNSTMYLSSLPSGERTCFAVFFKSPPAGWASYELGEPTYRTGGEPLPELTIYGDQGSYDPADGDYTIEGQVRNDDTSRVEWVEVVATLYDAAGTVVGCGAPYATTKDLNPGESSDFVYTFILRDYADAASYRLQADGKMP